MKLSAKIKQGTIIEGSYWSEPVEIKYVEDNGDYIHLIGATKISKEHIDQIIPREEFAEIKILDKKVNFSEEAWKVFLALETIRYRFASTYDPLLAMNTSKVDPLPHQIEAVYGYILKLPRIRFLIADDPGAGKTIMAGLIIKELKLRHVVKRILIVTPGHLKDQWRRELKERFDESFELIDRSRLESVYRENVWLKVNQVITSIDFAKMDDVLPSLTAANFELVVVDEAHKMSAYVYGKRTQKTSRYKLGEVLSKVTDHLLFLTATPHKGDTENFRLFLDLLEPGFFATDAMVYDSIAHKDNPLFIRRVKEDLQDFEGKPLFLPRQVKTIPFNLGANSPKEKELYNELSRYVNIQYNKALTKDKKRNVAFALVILQRRLASSTFALLRSLERRKKRLDDLLKGAMERHKLPDTLFDYDTVEDMSEEERWKEEEIWETLSVAENKEELKKEIDTLKELIDKARVIIQQEEELKLNELKKSLSELHNRYSDKSDRKILIFTESRDTLAYLEKKIKEWGYTVNTIHGGMKLGYRVTAESVFKNETEVLVATEAAGEGINLQFCNLMINYDIPWNPNRLEQRMGRIHRYGQQREVFIFNLVAEDTREGSVLNRLFQKLDEIRNAIGSDKVFDVLSDVLYNINLSQILVEAAANARNIDEILQGIDITVDEDYIAGVKENLGETLATHYIDYTCIKEMAEQAREHRLIPEYTESFFKKAYNRVEGKLKERKDGFLSVENVPFDIRKVASHDTFKRYYGELLKKYPKVTFDKEIAFKNPDTEFISFGHPLFEAVLKWVENTLSISLQNGATFTDPNGTLNGYMLFYEGEIKDGTGSVAGKRLFAFFSDGKDTVDMSPSVIWDLGEGKEISDDNIDIDDLKKQVSSKAIQSLNAYKQDLLEERKRQAEIKKKYGIQSLVHFILKMDRDLIDLYERKGLGQNVDIAIRNKEERKKEYEKALEELKVQIQQEKSLTMSMPEFIGIIRVTPSDTIDASMHSDKEIELIGMNMAMAYERNNGRFPVDVASENLGYDIRSVDNDGKRRYIEVKARARTKPVALTQNEWFKAHRFKDDYYLYVVFNAAHKGELYIIQNPADTVTPEEKIEMVRYIVGSDDIKAVGTLV